MLNLQFLLYTHTKMEYPLITDQKTLIRGNRYFFVPVVDSEGKATRYANKPLPVENGNYRFIKSGKLNKIVIENVYFGRNYLTFTEIEDNKGNPLVKPVTIQFETTHNIYNTTPVPGPNVTPSLARVSNALGKVRSLPNGAPCGGAGCAPLEAPVLNSIASVVATPFPTDKAINDLFLWAINGDFSSKTLANILARNPNVNELIYASINKERYGAIYINFYTLNLPASSKLTTKIKSSYYNENLCEIGPILPTNINELKCVQGVLDALIFRINDNHLEELEILLNAGADPNLGVITACHQRKPKALMMLLTYGARPENIILKLITSAGDFITYPVLAATPCSYELRIWPEVWRQRNIEIMNVLLTGTLDGSGLGYEGEPIITEEIKTAVRNKLTTLSRNRVDGVDFSPFIAYINEMLRLKVFEQELSHWDPNTGRLAQKLFEKHRKPEVTHRNLLEFFARENRKHGLGFPATRRASRKAGGTRRHPRSFLSSLSKE